MPIIRCLFLPLVFLGVSSLIYGQAEESEIYSVVDAMPRFQGCEDAVSEEAAKICSGRKLAAFLGEIRYPGIAVEKNLQGSVFIKFIINTDGSVSDIAVSISSGYAFLDSAAAAHIAGMPTWMPGVQRGKTVRVLYTVPFNFRLQQPEPIEEYGSRKKKRKKRQ